MMTTSNFGMIQYALFLAVLAPFAIVGLFSCAARALKAANSRLRNAANKVAA